MSFPLSLESLETRENPVGPVVSDPVAVASPPPANVGSPDPTPTQPVTGSSLTPSEIASLKILENTLAALGATTW